MDWLRWVQSMGKLFHKHIYRTILSVSRSIATKTYMSWRIVMIRPICVSLVPIRRKKNLLWKISKGPKRNPFYQLVVKKLVLWNRKLTSQRINVFQSSIEKSKVFLVWNISYKTTVLFYVIFKTLGCGLIKIWSKTICKFLESWGRNLLKRVKGAPKRSKLIEMTTQIIKLQWFWSSGYKNCLLLLSALFAILSDNSNSIKINKWKPFQAIY